MNMAERPRPFVLDLLESYAQERDMDVRLERRNDRRQWICKLSSSDDAPLDAIGHAAREAIMGALQESGLEPPA
jgi:Fe-S-cluster formation regulator IscX/YfhJ